MQILPLGVGGAFTEKFFHNNYIFQLGDQRLLVDAGTTLRYSLKQAGFSCIDIDYILITHFHSDHVGGLEEFLQRCYFRLENGVHTPYKPTLCMMESQVALFRQTLSAGLYNQNLVLEDYCHIMLVENLSKNQYTFKINDYTVKMIDTSNLHVEGMHSFGFKLSSSKDQRNVIFTSDIKQLSESGFNDEIDSRTLAIFHDLQPKGNPAHCGLDDIIRYYPNQYHSLIYAMHYPDNINEHVSTLKKHEIQRAEQGISINF
jgi:hydroxyacylglutathione hydrolase